MRVLEPGDTVYLRAGVYDTHIYPAASGFRLNARITYRGYWDVRVEIRNTTSPFASYYHGYPPRNRHYIHIDGVNVSNPSGAVPAGTDRPLMITHGSSYNQISRCAINGNGSGSIQIYDGELTGGTPVSHNWIHHCYIHHTGSIAWNGKLRQ